MAAQKGSRSTQPGKPINIRDQTGDEQHRSGGARYLVQSRTTERDGRQRMRDGLQ
jgi:hypothetical protein